MRRLRHTAAFCCEPNSSGNLAPLKTHAPPRNALLRDARRWCYGIANIGWMERKLASTLFATPPESSFEECALPPGNTKGYSSTYLAMGFDYVRAGTWFEH